MLRYLMAHQEPVRVTDVAEHFDISMPAASQYLRMLNSRGLLKAIRRGRHVFYEVKQDPSLPVTDVLLRTLRLVLDGRGKSVEPVFKDLTGFTHPRRIAVLQAVASGVLRVEDIRKQTASSQRATLRHLRKLVIRGYLVKRPDGYCVVRPRSELARSLAELVLSSH